jgi:hypothetical protein
MTLTDFDNQRVQLVGVPRRFFTRWAGNRAISEGLQVCIARVGRKQFMPRDHPSKVLVDHKHRVFERV